MNKGVKYTIGKKFIIRIERIVISRALGHEI